MPVSSSKPSAWQTFPRNVFYIVNLPGGVIYYDTGILDYVNYFYVYDIKRERRKQRQQFHSEQRTSQNRQEYRRQWCFHVEFLITPKSNTT